MIPTDSNGFEGIAVISIFALIIAIIFLDTKDDEE